VSVHLHKRVIPSRSRLLILSFWHLECFSPKLAGAKLSSLTLGTLRAYQPVYTRPVEWGGQIVVGTSPRLGPPRILHACAHGGTGSRTHVVPHLDNVLALTRGHDIARASSNKVVVGGSVTAQTIHRPVGVGETRDGRDKVVEINHWMIPFGLK